jgi:hypothetical protein
MLAPGSAIVTPRRRVGRPSKAEPFRAMMRAWLAAEPALRSAELLDRVRDAGYSGGKSAIYDLARELRPDHTSLVARIGGLPGAVSQHDIGQVFVRLVDGSTRRIRFLVSRLEYSGWTAISVLPDDEIETALRALVAHLAGMGGVPLLAVFDRPRSPFTAPGDHATIGWHPRLAALALALGIGLDLCTAGDRAPACCGDPVVSDVRSRFFKSAPAFDDEHDVQRQLATWVAESHAERFSIHGDNSPANRLAEEQRRLRPLKCDTATLHPAAPK